MKPADIEKIVVAKGPGSYTGVRIGVTIAKTLAWTLNIPLVGISSLEVLAAGVGRYFDGYISPLFDAVVVKFIRDFINLKMENCNRS